MNTRQNEYYALKSPGSKEAKKFLAMNDELARELCLAMEWEYIGPVDKPEPAPKPRRKRAAKRAAGPQSKSNPMLTIRQVKALAITARQAFDHLSAYDLIEEEGASKTARFDAWRARVCREVTGKESFRELRNDDFRALKAELLKLAGRPWDDPKAMARGKQSENRGDTMEAREQFIERIKGELRDHSESGLACSGQIGPDYVMAIAKRKNPKWNLSDFSSLIGLPAKQLEDLFFTIRNRIAAKEGRGQSENRNKKQKGKDE